MNRHDSARKILEILKEEKTFIVLRELAKEAKFPSVVDRDFKGGLNLLIEKGIVKLEQSGWKSEPRGYEQHEKAVILSVDIFQYVDSELEVNAEKILAHFVKNKEQAILMVKPLSEDMKNVLKNCDECQRKPVVFITNEQFPVCDKHWKHLAYANIEW